MKCRVFAVVPLVLFLSAGCTSHMRPSRNGPPSIAITGLVAKSAAGANYAFADLGGSSYDKKGFGRRAQPGPPFETAQNLKIEIAQQGPNVYHDFFVLLGAPLGSDDYGKGAFINSEPTFYVLDGWAYASGDGVRTKTDWVSGAAQGTEIVVRIVDDSTQEVYLLASNQGSAEIEVTCHNGNAGETIDNHGQEGYFVRITSGCVITNPARIADDADAQAFITAVEPIIAEAQ